MRVWRVFTEPNYDLICSYCSYLSTYYVLLFLYTVQAGVEAWLDATVYEVFVLPTVQFNQTILHLNVSLTNDFLYQVDYSDYHVEDISFHLHSAYSFFYLANQNTSHTTFMNYFGVILPDTVESTELISAVDGGIPLNDYSMKLEVTAGDTSLLNSDIIVHVVEPLPVLPRPGNT